MRFYWCIILACAWVLWRHSVGMGVAVKEYWIIDAAFETKQSCEEQAQPKTKEIEHGRKKSLEDQESKTAVVQIRAICLPDTIDPRPRN